MFDVDTQKICATCYWWEASKEKIDTRIDGHNRLGKCSIMWVSRHNLVSRIAGTGYAVSADTLEDFGCNGWESGDKFDYHRLDVAGLNSCVAVRLGFGARPHWDTDLKCLVWTGKFEKACFDDWANVVDDALSLVPKDCTITFTKTSTGRTEAVITDPVGKKFLGEQNQSAAAIVEAWLWFQDYLKTPLKKEES